ncbi:hypothetical protein ACI2K4_35255 [Micromonospora sp. NPDC050397]|uniref:hypothetical protein n=1 Tax=Micromonospora sp. NPDC050397 TaxID=3364279 RepID=UPI00385101CF
MSEQGKTYTTFIEAELKAERERRTQFDARGVALVTTSGGFVTLLAAVVALFRTGTATAARVFPDSGIPPLVVALVALTAAAGAGIVANWNRLYAVATPVTLDRLLHDRWGVDGETVARNHVGTIQVWTIDTLRRANNWKAAWISVGLAAQLVALVALGIVVLVLLAGGA